MGTVLHSTNTSQLMLADILRWRAQHDPDREIYAFLLDGETKKAQMTYSDLDLQARRIAALLQDGLVPGERVLLLYPPGLEYVAAIFGCFYAGVVAVPAYPPRLNQNLVRIQTILKDAQATTALTTSTILSSVQRRFAREPLMHDLHWIATDTEIQEVTESYREARTEPDALALLQYTSGSTGSPKGVMLTHSNLIQNAALLEKGLLLTSQDLGLSWLPPYHDMGLMAGIIQSLYTDYPTLLMAPAAFLQRPLRWLQAISSFHVTFSGGPNFAYDLCVKRATPDIIGALDLRSWTMAFNGAESVRAQTLEHFTHKFAPCGFRSETFSPCYGLAEATLFGSSTNRFEKPKIRAFNGEALEAGHAVEARDDWETAQLLVSCGSVRLGQEVAIVDPEKQTRCAPGTIGEIWLSGPNVAPGYWRKTEETHQTFQAFLRKGSALRLFECPSAEYQSDEGPFLRTGDLGFCVQEELYITGRLKDLIIIGGRNLYPQDIEQVVEKSHPLLRPDGYCAVFTVEGEVSEQLIVVQEVVRHYDDAGIQEAIQAICQAVLWEFDVEVAAVELLRTGTIPKTSSGKIQRQACRQSFLQGDLNAVFRWKRAQEHHQLGAQHLQEQDELSNHILDGMQKKIWAEVLELERVGSSDNFFALGGHSLLALRLLARIQEVSQVEITLADLLEAPTPSAFAELVARRRASQAKVGEGGAALLPAIVPDLERRYEPFPTTDVQQAYWVGRHADFALGNVGNHGYIEVEATDLDLNRFNQALQRLIERHEMLRAVLLPDGQQQILERVPPFQIKIRDLCGQDQEEQTDQLAQIRHMLDHQLLSVEQWPAFEIWISRLDDRRVRIHLSIESIFVDAWSVKTLIHEFVRLYHEPDLFLPASVLSFRDYVLAEASLRLSAQYQQSREYWLSRLSSLPPHPDLPLVPESERIWHRPRFVHREARLGRERWQRLKAKASKIGVTPSGVLLTAFADVLARWSKTARFSLNLTTFNRVPLHPSVNEMVGDFTSLLVLAIDHTTPASFEKRAKRLQEQLWLDLDHSSYSGIAVLRELVKTQGEGFKAFIPIVFTSLLIGDTAIPLPPPWGKTLYNVTQTPQVWLDHQVLEIGGELVFHWQSVDAMFPAGLIDDMFAAYCQLLQNLSCGEASWANPMVWELLPEQQRALLAHVNETSVPVSDKLLHTCFFEQAARHPDQLALISPAHRLTYKQVSSGALQLAHQLRDWGACPNQLVGVVMEKGWEQIVAVLGILRSGAAYLPIDANLPAERLRYLLKNGLVGTACPVVVTQSWIERRIEWPMGVKRICVDSLDLDKEDIPRLDAVQSPEDLAYVIYTSGSTGMPKGVMIDHRGAVNTILDINRRFSISSSDRVFALSALNFDLSVYDIFGILAAGATIVLPEEQSLRDPSSWLTMIEQEQVTIWNTVPALLQLLVEYVEGSTSPTRSLRLALLSGDWIPLTLPGRLKELSPAVEVISLGGATEASIWSILYPITTVDACRQWFCKTVPYGKPMVNQQVFVLGKDLEPCPVWVPGDLYIAGIGLAKGYWRDEEKTQASFFVHPQTGKQLYRTGDMGRYLPDGNIEFLGREDFQVKVHGHRIELGEIEQTLLLHPEVQAAVASVITEPQGDKRLAAYVILQSEHISHEQKKSYETLHLRFGQTSVRKDPDKPVIDLAPVTRRDSGKQESASTDVDTLRKYRQRLSYRQFLPVPLSFQQLSDFLRPLSRIELEGLPKYLYPSAGSIYPVQTYLAIQPGGVEGLAAGIYYYNPELHQLTLLTQGAGLERGIHATINQPIFDQSAFSLFLIGDLTTISLQYGDAARDFCLLEAGYMGQLLMMTAPEQRIGLCPVGLLDFGQVREVFALGENHLLLHSFICGSVDPDAANGWSFLPGETNNDETLQLAQAKETRSAVTFTPMEQGQKLRRFLDEKLPAYMVPSSILILDQWPLTANGKVDRRALPVPDANSTEVRSVEGGASHAHTAPRTPIEEIVGAIWCEILEHSQVGVYDDFFALGGQSLQIMRIASRVKSLFQVEIPLSRLFGALTVAKMARSVEDARGLSEHLSKVPPLVPVQHAETIPLSFAQQRLWFLSQLHPESTAYILPNALHICGPLNIHALERSLEGLCQRHEILRTTFEERAGQPIQVIHPVGGSGPALSLQLDMQRLHPSKRMNEVKRLVRQEAQKSMDLAQGRLLRTTLFRLDTQEYVLLLTLHHIIGDAKSMGVFIEELTTFYQAFSADLPFPLPDLALQYRDFAVWQRAWLQEGGLEQQMAYWAKRLDGLVPLELPTDHPRPALQTFRGAHQSCCLLSPSLLDKLKSLSREVGTTLFMTVLAAFQALLSRYTGQTDVAIGMMVTNRSKPEIEGLIGLFVNTLVIRTDLSNNPAFRTLLGRVRQGVIEAIANQDIPLEELVARLQPERQLSRTPFFQIVFTSYDPLPTDISLGDLVVNALPVESGTAKFDLTVEVLEKEQGLEIVLEYNTDLFEADTIERMIGAYCTLLEGVVTNPDQSLSDLPLLTEGQRRQILVEWNTTLNCEGMQESILHRTFEAQVEQGPDRLAVIFGDLQLTYAALNVHANRLAHRLREMGVGPEVPVAICAERSLELTIGLVAILKAGGAFVPLDPSYPHERLAFMLQDCQASVLLTDRSLVAALPTLYLDEASKACTADDDSNLWVPVHEENLAYIIYTSGSTGTPKGAMNTHHGICNRLLWMQETYQLIPEDRVLQKTPFSFDVSVWEFFWPWLAGACLIVASPGGHRDPAYLKALIAQQQVTTVHFVPSMLHAFLLSSDVQDCESLRQVMCSGEALTTSLQACFFAHFSEEVHLHNLYGPTEAAIDVTFWECQRDSENKSVPIGHPIVNTQIYILDKDLQPVPIGVTGELYIGGVGLARGYFKRPDLTAEKFIANPFVGMVPCACPGERLYCTGDLARHRVDGAIEFVGRPDQQVKIRGYRIELGEIETTLLRHPTVHEAVVVAREDTPGEKHLPLTATQLVAYVVARVGESPETGVGLAPTLREYCREQLPDYMVPAFFVLLEALPLSPNGKADRRALPVPERSTFDLQGGTARTPVEEVVLAIYREVLGVGSGLASDLGIHESFFDLGGHSLLAIQVISRIRSAMGVELSVRNLFETPSVAGLAGQIERQLRAGKERTMPPLVAMARAQDLPLSFAQQRLWFQEQMVSDHSAYVLPLVLRLRGSLHVSVLEECLREMVRRHESLRTTFTVRLGQPIQIIHADAHIPLAVIDLCIGDEKKQLELFHLLNRGFHQPFDLSRGPLMRVGLLRLQEQEHLFYLMVHHIIFDAWSTSIFFRELSLLYEAFLQRKPSPLPPLALQYVDVALWQRDWLKGAVLDTLVRYWTKQLAGAVPVQMPTDRPRSAIVSDRGAIYPFTLPTHLWQQLTALSREVGVTLFMTLLTAFQIVLSRTTGQNDIVVGTDSANRTEVSTEQIIGFFVNLLALRVQISAQSTFRETVKRVCATVLAAYAHQDLPFERLVDALQLERNPSQVPLINVLFVLNNIPQQMLALPGLTVSTVESEIQTAKFDVALFLMESDEKIAGYVNYRTDLFDANTIVALVRHFEVLLHSIVTAPDSPVEMLEMFTKQEREQTMDKERVLQDKKNRLLKVSRRHIMDLTPEI